ncbi:MAG: glycosyltransferase family 39 protein [Candidatus Sumerlaeia bacterium]|nr:glycosyltransferase family 39 protein [Candidatus Sumerlaeia bacterium]
MSEPDTTPRHRAEAVGLFGVLALAAVLRLQNLGTNPPGLFRDELEKGYTALELWRTGRHGYFDGAEIVQSGPMPAFINVFGDQTSAIYQYLSAPIVGIFGLDGTTVRLAAALCGIATVLAVWALARRWHGPVVGVFAAGLVATMPQAVVFSRWAQQGVTVPFFAALGVAAFWSCFHGASRHRTGLAVLSGFLLGVAFYAYDPARVGVPLIVLALAAGLGRAGLTEHRRHAALWAGTFFAVALPVFLYAIGDDGSYRFRRVSVFADGLGPGIATAASQYLEHFHPRFLFFGGDTNPRHQLVAPGIGIMASTFAVLLLASGYGVWQRFRSGQATREDLARWLLLGAWLLGAPLAAAFTTGGIPHALRSILFVPAWCLLAAEGPSWFGLADKRRVPRGTALLAAVVVVNFAFAWLGVRNFATHRPDAWQADVIPSLRGALAADPTRPVFISAAVPYAPYFALFVEQPDPARFQELGLAALRTRIAPPGAAAASLPEGALLVLPEPAHSAWAETEPPTITLERATRDGRPVFQPFGGGSRP